MRQLMGADTRRVDGTADRLDGHCRDVQNLAIMAQRAVLELRNAWDGRDFEHIAQRWEHEAGPRLTAAASSVSAMAVVLRVQAAEQRRVSGDAGSGRVSGDARSGRVSGDARNAGVPVGAGASPGQPTLGGGVPSVGVQQAQTNALDVDVSLVSAGGGTDSPGYQLAAGRVEATAGSSLDVDTDGNLTASAGASAAAYLGYAVGRVQAGRDLAQVGAGTKVFVGAEVVADATSSIGPAGATGSLGAMAFAGGKAVVSATATIAGATAAAGAEISYGIGAQADVDAEVSFTKVGIALDIGATLGLGFGVSFDVSVNPREVIDSIDHAMDREPD